MDLRFVSFSMEKGGTPSKCQKKNRDADGGGSPATGKGAKARSEVLLRARLRVAPHECLYLEANRQRPGSWHASRSNPRLAMAPEAREGDAPFSEAQTERGVEGQSISSWDPPPSRGIPLRAH